jgi:hypothetical protein
MNSHYPKGCEQEIKSIQQEDCDHNGNNTLGETSQRKREKHGRELWSRSTENTDSWSDLTDLSHCKTQNRSSGQSLSPAKAANLLSLMDFLV